MHAMHENRTSRTVIAMAAAVIAAVLTAMMVATAVAAQPGVPAKFGSHGEGAGQFEEARGIAVTQGVGVDGENGNVYLVDRNNSRVDEFSGNGVFVRAWGWGVMDGAEAFEVCTTATGCTKGSRGFGAGQFGREAAEGIAVDNSTGFSRGDVYVVDGGNARVEKFNAEGEFEVMFGGEVNATKDGTAATEAERDVCTEEEITLDGVECKAGIEGSANGEFERPEHNEIAIDPQGRVYVGDASRVQRFSEDGAYEATVLSGVGAIEALAIAPNGDLYVQSSGQSGMHEYEPNGSEVSPAVVRDASGNPRSAMAVDGAGNLFIDDLQEFVVHHIFEYDAEGAQTESFDRAPKSGDAESGLAWGEAAEALYLINDFTEVRDGKLIELADVRTVSPPAPGPVSIPPVTAHPHPHNAATVEGMINPEGAKTEYLVEYGTDGALGSTSVVKSLPASFEDMPVSVELTGLQFSTEYHYCLVARNTAGTTPCAQQTFVSAPATSIDAEWTADVTGESATLAAAINPEDTATTCRFEYGAATVHASEGIFEHVVPASAVVAPEDADVTVSAHVQEGIRPGIEYAYRAVCEKEATTDDGKVQSFRSQPGGSEASLPDGRALELVATAVKGAGLLPPEEGLPQGSETGAAIAYERLAATAADAAANRAPEPTVDLARHEERGWSSIDMTTPYDAATPVSDGQGSEYRLFSGDLSAAIVAPWDATPLSPSASERTPYRRTEAVHGEALYEPLLTTADVAEGVKFGGSTEDIPEHVEGADAALAHVLLGSEVALTAGGVPDSVYEWSSGSLAPVSVLPASEGGAIVSGRLGGPQENARHAVSTNGALVYWSGGAGLNVRDIHTEESLRLDVPQPGVVPQSGEVHDPVFQIASADGSRVFFTDTQRLTTDATAAENAPDLYECTLTIPPAGALSCALTDITAETLVGGESAAVEGFVAAADETGDRVYFVARGALTARATAGEDNLYTAVEAGGVWQVTWIATLGAEDAQDWASSPDANVSGLAQLTERSSPDGRWFTFMSARSLTGYDNHDAVTGFADEEVYLYDAQSGKLSCMSCDPTGARPRAILDEGKATAGTAGRSPVDVEGVWAGHRLAGLLPGWQNLFVGGTGVRELTAYQPRSLSDGGRLFFDSATALTPKAANGGTMGVYEFEPAGVGSCTAAASGYSSATGGCISLISPSTAARDAVLLDASANGDDVFLMSTAGAEGEQVYSIYDAHSCEAGSSWTCTTSAPPASTGCETTAGCTGHPRRAPTALGSPPDSSVAGRTGQVLGRHAVHRRVERCRAKARRLANAKKRRRALARCMADRKRRAARARAVARRRAGR